MIRDVLVIKDGLPLFTKNLSRSEELFTNQNRLVMISGFLSALNSFSDQFENFGNIKELKLTNTHLRFSFLKHDKIPNLLFLASFDENSKSVKIQKFLQRLSHKFLKEFNIQKIENWNGKPSEFEGFGDLLSMLLKEEDLLEDKAIDVTEMEQVFGFSKNQIRLNQQKSAKKCTYGQQKEISKPAFYSFKPSFKTSKKINPEYYLTGESSIQVFNMINGEKTIEKIANEIRSEPEKVHSICKNLVKMGFITISKRN